MNKKKSTLQVSQDELKALRIYALTHYRALNEQFKITRISIIEQIERQCELRAAICI